MEETEACRIHLHNKLGEDITQAVIAKDAEEAMSKAESLHSSYKAFKVEII